MVAFAFVGVVVGAGLLLVKKYFSSSQVTVSIASLALLLPV